MTKLVIQIPCFNEESTLPATLASLPRSVPGVDEIEVLVVDDGSDDDTVAVAREHGADHVHSLGIHQGLARAFEEGLRIAVARGANVIVNTDADNQYRSDDIPRLIEPILAGEAEIVVGERPIEEIAHFSSVKKALQRLGSWVVRKASGTAIPDAASGFRALSREAAQRVKVFNDYSHTLETIIQAGHKGMAITSVPVRTNEQLRPSRLYGSVLGYIRRQAITIVRIFMTYRSFEFFAFPGAVAFATGFAIGFRFLYFYLSGDGTGHVQSLILGALLLGTGFFLVIVGLLADLASVNRKLLEDLNWRMRQLEETGPDSDRK